MMHCVWLRETYVCRKLLPLEIIISKITKSISIESGNYSLNDMLLKMIGFKIQV